MFQLIMNQWLDYDDTYTYDWYQWDVEAGLRSRSQGQGQICYLVKYVQGQIWNYV